MIPRRELQTASKGVNAAPFFLFKFIRDPGGLVPLWHCSVWGPLASRSPLGTSLRALAHFTFGVSCPSSRNMGKHYSKHLLGFYFFRTILSTVFGGKKKKKKTQLCFEAGLVWRNSRWPAKVPRAVKSCPFTLLVIIRQKQQGKGLTSCKDSAFFQDVLPTAKTDAAGFPFLLSKARSPSFEQREYKKGENISPRAELSSGFGSSGIQQRTQLCCPARATPVDPFVPKITGVFPTSWE